MQRELARTHQITGIDWAEIVKGDERAFEQLIDRMTPALSRLAYRLMGWQANATQLEDLLQDVFAKVWTERSKFRGQSAPETWITSIALNLCRRHIRRAELWRRAMRWIGKDVSFQQPLPDDRWASVAAALAKLPLGARELIVLHYLEGYPIDEIAQTLGVRKNTVEVRLHRARKQLQQLVISGPEDDHARLSHHRTATLV